MLLAAWRLLRCNPFSHGGFDPVPERFTLRVGPVDPAVYHGEAQLVMPPSRQHPPQPLVDIANEVLVSSSTTTPASAGAASIIALTVCTRALLIPLTYKQLKGMRALQALQPQIKEIQEKYKNDKQRMQQEMMRFYQENKVNPFASCIPLLAQLPVFITLFYVLRHELPATSADGKTAANCGSRKRRFLFINDLTAKATGRRTDRPARPLRRHPAGLGHGDGGHRRQKPADDDDGPALHLRPLRHQLPGRPRPLLDHDQLLDDRPAVRDQTGHPAPVVADAGGRSAAAKPPPPPPKKKKQRRRTVAGRARRSMPKRTDLAPVRARQRIGSAHERWKRGLAGGAG